MPVTIKLQQLGVDVPLKNLEDIEKFAALGG